MGNPFLTPLYISFFLLGVAIYLIGAFILGAVGAALTLPVLYYTGYGLLPPQLTPAGENVELPAAVSAHLGLGGLFAVFSLIITLPTSQAISSPVRYRFARMSPRLEAVPKIGLAMGAILLVWIGYLLYAREEFDGETKGERRNALLTSVIAAIVFGISSIAVAVLSRATLYV